ncbi:phospholipase A and acyltransferase 3-like [Paroedura picta]|uniref:phospholipase A and acyltransferase 3-like n=1 Tax=Paroedura picta TaxID=143630 RepID=UPI0040564E9A
MSWEPEVKPESGDLIEIHRPFYQHWAIYIGEEEEEEEEKGEQLVPISNGYVVHFAPESGLLGLASVILPIAVVKKERLQKVVGNDKYVINKKYDERFQPLPVDEIISRAKAMVGRTMPYSLLDHNCEHFVTKLRYDTAVCDQVSDGLRWLLEDKRMPD